VRINTYFSGGSMHSSNTITQKKIATVNHINHCYDINMGLAKSLHRLMLI